MKIKDGFVLRTVAGETVALPTHGVTDVDMMITLNDTGRFLWECLQKDTDENALVEALLGEYEVSREMAAEAVAAFVAQLKEQDFLA
jgi:hypothetical protein